MYANTLSSLAATLPPVLAITWLTPAQAADRIGVHVDFIYKNCAAGGLKHSVLAGRRNIRIRAEWLDEWMLEHERVNR